MSIRWWNVSIYEDPLTGYQTVAKISKPSLQQYMEDVETGLDAIGFLIHFKEYKCHTKIHSSYWEQPENTQR